MIPQNTNETEGAEVLNALFTPLVEYDPETSEMTFDGAMAESIESEDQINWTITIKDGWTFRESEARVVPVTGPRRGGDWARAAAVGVLVLGSWLFFAARILSYDFTEAAVDANLNEVFVGLVAVILAIPRIARPHRYLWTGLALTAAGAWLALAPFVIGYADEAGRATANDVVVGCAIAVLSLVSMTSIGSRRRAA